MIQAPTQKGDCVPSGSPMVESLVVKNFRCFQHLELRGLKRINIIVGRNASGKTALLESIFLAAGGSPELALRLRFFRGMGQGLQLTIDRRSYESLWRDLFFSLDHSRTISAEIVGSPANTRSLTIVYKDQASLTLPLGKQMIDSALIIPIVFEWRDSKGESHPVEVKITEQGLSIGTSIETVQCAFFSTAAPAANPVENASRFSELSKQNKLNAVIEAVRSEFPSILDLSLEINAGINMIYATVDSLQEKVPVGMVSGGVNKLLNLLLAVASYPQGVVLVDEIENGFYHDRLPKIWSALMKFCKRYDTQLFASTHSLECLRAVLPSIRDNGDGFCVIRTEKENEQCTARLFGGRQLESAIEQEVEVR